MEHEMEMCMDRVKETIAQAYKEDRHLKVIGYVTSDGSMYDFTLALPKVKSYYHDLSHESLVELKSSALGVLVPGMSQEDLNAVFSAAVTEVIRSLEKSLDPETAQHADLAYTASGEGWSTFVPKGASAPEPDTIYLRNAQLIKRTAINIIDKPKRKSSDKVRVKNAIKEGLPINKYFGQLKLAPGKFSAIRVV